MSPLVLQPASVKSIGMFRGASIIIGRPQTFDLLHFLTHSTGAQVYVRKYRIWNGTLRLDIPLSNGSRMEAIGGVGGYGSDYIYIAVREELLESGKARKVLYGWIKEEEWGVIGKANIQYILSTKDKPPGRWKVLKEPIALKGLTQMQKALQAHEATIDAGTKGLGRKRVKREWTVIKHHTGGTYVYYTYNGKNIEIHGFAGLSRVYSEIYENKGQIVVRFYDAADYKNQIKEVVLSEKNKKTRVWEPLLYPKVISTSVFHPVQYVRLRARDLRSFLEEDQPEGAILDLEPRRIDNGGAVRFAFDSYKEEDGGIVLFCGYKGYSKVVGRVVVEKTEKRVCFWPDVEARENGAPAIIENGQVFAKRDNLKAPWKIVWQKASEKWRQKRREALAYGKWLFATKGDAVRVDHLEVREFRDDKGRVRRRACRMVRGKRLSFDVTAYSGVNSKIVFVSRELQRRVKIGSVWLEKDDYRGEEPPIVTRFLTFKPENNGWRHFFASLDAVTELRRLIDQGLISRKVLGEVLSDPFLLRFHGEIVWPVVDSLKLYGPHE